MAKGILIAATSSGCGKTTFTMGLLRLLRNRGLRVQPFKCGPDYIDTMWHTQAAGRASVNLDLWMSSAKHVRELFERHSDDADVSVVEGVMGLFDGYDRARGSCAEIAKALDIPVVLLVNAKSMAYSAAAMIYGFTHFDPAVRVAGVVFNQVSSDSHYAYLRRACADASVPCLGYMKRAKDIELPSRHLGLTIDERYKLDEYIERVADVVGEVEGFVGAGDSGCGCGGVECGGFDTGGDGFKGTGRFRRIAVARDEAFNFTYRANIEALERMGAVSYFSPIGDECVPPGTDFLYLPGGYPEFHLEQLSANTPMLRSVREYIDRGGHGLAECGGMLYLCQSVVGMGGVSYPMAGVLNMRGTFEGMRLHLGYRRMELDGREYRGHEFHYSDIVPVGDGEPSVGTQFNAKGERISTRLFRKQNFYSGYTHWYWAERGDCLFP